MGKQNRTLGIVFLSATVLVTYVNSEAQNMGANTNMESIETSYALQASAGGIGADQQDAVSKAVELIKQGQFARAETILNNVLSRFATLMVASNHTYVCFRKTKDYRHFLKEIQTKQTPQARVLVTRVHDSLTQALQMKAYIASSQKQWDRAIEYLERKISYAPYEAQPHLEAGYILNAQGKPQQAVESYKKGYTLAVTHSATKTEQAAALRGMGSAQIELGKLDDAVDSFKKSLQIQPGNKVALNELRYIEHMKAKSR